MESKAIRYAYAINSDNELIHISEVKENEQLKCPSCNINMIAAKGRFMQHHFRHGENGCGYESYLHQSAKIAFFNKFTTAKDQNQPLELKLNRAVECNSPKASILEKINKKCLSTTTANYDLTTLFEIAELEKKDSKTGLTPDVLLTNNFPNLHKCYIEIYVTHKCSEDKISSEIPIIEFEVKDEKAIKYIRNGKFNENDQLLKVYHFKPKNKIINQCVHTCSNASEKINIWSLSLSGRLIKKQCNLASLDNHELHIKNCWPNEIMKTQEDNLIKEMLELNDPHSYYPNCIRCKFYQDRQGSKISCSIKSNTPDYIEANLCMHYEVV